MFAMFCDLCQVVGKKLGGPFGQNIYFAVDFDSGVAPLNPVAYDHRTTTSYNVFILSKAALMSTHPCPSCNGSSDQAHTSHCSLHITLSMEDQLTLPSGTEMSKKKSLLLSLHHILP